jgi:outer membrane protein OmpA-like peptidoglycan-associated protein
MNLLLNKKPAYFCLLCTLLLAGCATPGDGGKSTDSAKRTAVKVTQTSRGALITSDERILFDTGKAEIKSNGKVFIDRVSKILKDKTKANVLVEGHTDNVGGEKANLQLSSNRANAVRSGLIQSGVDGKRITTKGLGMSQPVADNNTPEGRQSNRRTEILVIGETVENIGGTSLGDRLQEGLENFLKDPVQALKNVFGSTSEK